MNHFALAAASLSLIGASATWTGVFYFRRLLIKHDVLERTFEVGNGGGKVTVTAPMPDTDYETLKARWQAAYGIPGIAHPVTEVHPTSEEPRS